MFTEEDFDSHCSNELIDIETVDIIKVNENINVAEGTYFKLSENYYSFKRTKFLEKS